MNTRNEIYQANIQPRFQGPSTLRTRLASITRSSYVLFHSNNVVDKTHRLSRAAAGFHGISLGCNWKLFPRLAIKVVNLPETDYRVHLAHVAF